MKTSDNHQWHEGADAPRQTTAGAWLLHPAVLILLWVFLAIAMQLLHAVPLLLAGIPLMLMAVKLSAVGLFTLLRRTRWIMLSLLLIYAYVTPGEAMWPHAGMFSPTQEGLIDGLLQLCRLVFALAGLSMVLSLLQQRQLVGGLYALVYPLCYLGLSRERVAVRLALTLHYAESAMQDTAAGWRDSLERMLSPEMAAQHSIELGITPFTRRDALLLVAAAILLVLVLW